MAKNRWGIQEGPGLKLLQDQPGPYYGKGYCGVCGVSKTPPLVPALVRWWDPDDGWKVGVLCEYCADQSTDRGPQPEDYAVATKRGQRQDEIDLAIELDDPDSVAADDWT